jgi:hypothetical protein
MITDLAVVQAYHSQKVVPKYAVENYSSVGTVRTRKLRRGEAGGKSYDVFSFKIGTLAGFGLGVPMYFYIVLEIGLACLLSGLMTIPRIMYYASDDYGTNSTDVRVQGTAACSPSMVVPAICSGNMTCDAQYRSDCKFPSVLATWADVGMVLIMIVAILIAVLYQENLQRSKSFGCLLL